MHLIPGKGHIRSFPFLQPCTATNRDNRGHWLQSEKIPNPRLQRIAARHFRLCKMPNNVSIGGSIGSLRGPSSERRSDTVRGRDAVGKKNQHTGNMRDKACLEMLGPCAVALSAPSLVSVQQWRKGNGDSSLIRNGKALPQAQEATARILSARFLYTLLRKSLKQRTIPQNLSAIDTPGQPSPKA